MSKKDETKNPANEDFEENLVLKEPGKGFEVWKPTKIGEAVKGKLMSITKTKFNPVLRISTELDGVVSVPVSTFLEDIDFERYIGQILTLEFAGLAGRGCKLFKVSVEVPKF